MRKRYIP